jgi:hypothetical protein
LAAGAALATETNELMKLIFGDQRLDLRDFRELVPQLLRVTPPKAFDATTTGLRLHGRDRPTLFDWNQHPVLLGMARLTARLLAALLLLCSRPRMRMFGAWRQRGIPRLFLERGHLAFPDGDPPILLCDSRQQQADDRLCFWRGPDNHAFRDKQFLRHANDVADFVFGAKANLDAPATPARERLRCSFINRRAAR